MFRYEIGLCTEPAKHKKSSSPIHGNGKKCVDVSTYSCKYHYILDTEIQWGTLQDHRKAILRNKKGVLWSYIIYLKKATTLY